MDFFLIKTYLAFGRFAMYSEEPLVHLIVVHLILGILGVSSLLQAIA